MRSVGDWYRYPSAGGGAVDDNYGDEDVMSNTLCGETRFYSHCPRGLYSAEFVP